MHGALDPVSLQTILDNDSENEDEMVWIFCFTYQVKLRGIKGEYIMFIFTTIFFLLLVQLLSVASSSSTTPVAVPTTMAVDAHSRQSSESGDEKDSDVDECGSCGLGDCGR